MNTNVKHTTLDGWSIELASHSDGTLDIYISDYAQNREVKLLSDNQIGIDGDKGRVLRLTTTDAPPEPEEEEE